MNVQNNAHTNQTTKETIHKTSCVSFIVWVILLVAMIIDSSYSFCTLWNTSRYTYCSLVRLLNCFSFTKILNYFKVSAILCQSYFLPLVPVAISTTIKGKIIHVYIRTVLCRIFLFLINNIMTYVYQWRLKYN